MDICLLKFDISQGTVAPNCFNSHTNSLYFDFFQKKFRLMFDLKFTLSDVTLFLPDNLPCFNEVTFNLAKHTILDVSHDPLSQSQVWQLCRDYLLSQNE